MGIVQGLTEFLPISSSGHLSSSRTCSGWDDAFINSLAFSVMLHLGTLVALLVYFRADWVRLVPAGLRRDPRPLVPGRPGPPARVAAGRGDHPGRDRRRSCSTTSSRTPSASVGWSRVMLVVGGVILWVADRSVRRPRSVDDVTFPVAIGIGVAQALALIPGISRSGISISAGRFAGLDREAAARFAFLMATPITLGADRLRGAQARDRRGRRDRRARAAASSGWSRRFVAGLLAIHFMLALPADALARHLRRRTASCWRRSCVVVLADAVEAHDRWRS